MMTEGFVGMGERVVESKDVVAERILKGANEEQKEIIMFKDGRCLANSSSGSGKTFSVTQRLKYLVEIHEVPQEQVYLISYTNRAVKEIKDRLGEEYSKCFISTIHVMCNTILRDNKIFLNIADKFKLQGAMKKCGISEDQIGNVVSFVGLNKNNNIRVEDVDKYINNKGFSTKQAKFFYESYERALKSIGACDFDDIILKCIDLLKGSERLRAKYSEKWQYIILDEAGDTNIVTDLVVSMIANHRNIMYVGDVKQCIGAYRGNSPEVFLDFNKREQAQVVQLKTNYRSLPLIVYTANSYIRPHYIDTGIYEDSLCGKKNGSDGEIYINKVNVVDEIDRLIKEENVNPSDISILYRMNKMSEKYELGLAIRAIPYVVRGGNGFFKQKDVKAIMGFIRLTQDEKDMASFLDCYNSPSRFLGIKFLEEVNSILSKHDISIIKSLSYLDNWHFSKGIAQIQAVHRGMSKLSKPSEMVDYFLRNTNYYKSIDECSDEDEVKAERKEIVKALIELISENDSFEELFDIQSKMLSENVEGVTLSTIHSFKGLESRYVFLVDCDKGLFPDKRCTEKLQEINLFYVGISRAKEVMHILGNSEFVEDVKEILENKKDNWRDEV
jgi:DNA helicase-2/ATP-dependent DNA helicase PcrA